MLSGLGAYLVAGGVALGAALFGFLRLRLAQLNKARSDRDRADAYIETRKRMDHAPTVADDDPDAARRWLRDRAKR